MYYHKTIRLRDGRSCTLRSAAEGDAAAALELFLRTHAETDFLRSYPEENTATVEDEARYIRRQTDSPRAVELLAELDGEVVALAGIEGMGEKGKTRHRAQFGISVVKACWGLGLGRAMLRACVDCARAVGYSQIELDVVADNRRAVALYESEGFVIYGRNPRGFRSRESGWQELLLMRLELD